jgi:cytoskeletal protein CcmA (bactofilin family)
MKVRTKIIRLLLLAAVLLLPTARVHAQTPRGDVFLLGQNYTLEEGQELNGSLAVIGGNVTIEENAVVEGDVILVGGNLDAFGSANGDIVLIGGSLEVSDEVSGDIVVVGGQVELTATAVVDGDITTIGGQVKRDPEAQVSGDIINNAPPLNFPVVPDVPGIPSVPEVPSVPDVPTPPVIEYSYDGFQKAMDVFGFALVVALIGMLLVLFFQVQFERVGDAIVRQPVIAGSFGLLAVVVAPLAILVMVLTLILIPVAAIAAFLIPLAWLFGVVALGQEVGDRFTRAINQTWAPVLSTGFGTFLLMLLGGFIGMVPCVGWLVPSLVALMGIGGVAMTWFGTHAAPGAVPASVEVPPTS